MLELGNCYTEIKLELCFSNYDVHSLGNHDSIFVEYFLRHRHIQKYSGNETGRQQ